MRQHEGPEQDRDLPGVPGLHHALRHPFGIPQKPFAEIARGRGEIVQQRRQSGFGRLLRHLGGGLARLRRGNPCHVVQPGLRLHRPLRPASLLRSM